MENKTQKEVSARIALLVLSILWGSTFVAIAGTADFFNPAFLLALRFSIGFVVLSLIFIKRYKNLNKTYLKAGFLAGLSSFLGYFPQAVAITSAGSDPGRSAFLVSTYCVLVPFVSWAVNKKRPDKFNIVAAFLGFAGIGFISLPNILSGQQVGLNWGDIFSLISSVAFGFNLVLLERLAPNLDTPLFSIVHFMFAGVFAWLYTLCFENNALTVWSYQSIGTLLYLSIPCTSLTVLLQTYGQKYTPASTAALFFALESVFGLTFSVWLGLEKLTWTLLLGGSLIVFAIIITETKLSFIYKKRF